MRSYAIWAPALSYPYYGEVQGVIRTIDRSASGSLRVTLRVSEMDPISERHRPQYVRISFPKYAGDIPEMGQSIKTTAYVTPPQGPVEPDGFDFRRHAYFQSLGGATYVVWTGEGYAIKKRVDKHHAPYAWQPTSKRRHSIGADQSN
jgi:competence protein ComEC